MRAKVTYRFFTITWWIVLGTVECNWRFPTKLLNCYERDSFVLFAKFRDGFEEGIDSAHTIIVVLDVSRLHFCQICVLFQIISGGDQIPSWFLIRDDVLLDGSQNGAVSERSIVASRRLRGLEQRIIRFVVVLL